MGKDILDKIADKDQLGVTYNPLLNALREGDKKNLFTTNVTTSFIKTGFHLYDYYFGSTININNELGEIIAQEPRVGQASGTFNMIIGNTGSGKAQPNYTKIPTPSGYVLMSDIKIGDKIFGSDGKIINVVGVFPQGIKDIYEITFSDGRTSRCCKDHLWTFKNKKNGKLLTKSLEYIIESDDDVFIQQLQDPISYNNRDNEFDASVYASQLIELYMANKEIYIDESYIFSNNRVEIYNELLLYSDDILKNTTLYDQMKQLEYSLGYVISTRGRERYLKIEDIKLVDKCEATCIKVDSIDSLYVSENFVITHNTTLTVQLVANILRQYEFATAMHFDCEQRFDISRAETISQLPSHYFQDNGQGARYVIRSGTVALDSIQESIVKIYSTKMKMKKELTVNSGFKDEFGNDVMMMQPTLVIIDSITSVLSETFSPDNAKDVSDAAKLQSNTEGARSAKTLKGFFKDVLPLCKEANIIVFAINHISTNMSMNAFVPVSKQQNFLKQDESIPGGKTLLYYPFNIIKLTAKPGDDYTEESDGFTGHMVMVEPVKSSSNQSGNNSKGVSFEMVFSFKQGFDSLRTIVMYARDRGIIEGTKNRLKFKDDPSFTFSMKNINKDKDEKPIWENIKKYVIPELNTHLSFIEPSNTKFDNRMMDY